MAKLTIVSPESLKRSALMDELKKASNTISMGNLGFFNQRALNKYIQQIKEYLQTGKGDPKAPKWWKHD